MRAIHIEISLIPLVLSTESDIKREFYLYYIFQAVSPSLPLSRFISLLTSKGIHCTPITDDKYISISVTRGEIEKRLLDLKQGL